MPPSKRLALHSWGEVLARDAQQRAQSTEGPRFKVSEGSGDFSPPMGPAGDSAQAHESASAAEKTRRPSEYEEPDRNQPAVYDGIVGAAYYTLPHAVRMPKIGLGT